VAGSVEELIDVGRPDERVPSWRVYAEVWSVDQIALARHKASRCKAMIERICAS